MFTFFQGKSFHWYDFYPLQLLSKQSTRPVIKKSNKWKKIMQLSLSTRTRKMSFHLIIKKIPQSCIRLRCLEIINIKYYIVIVTTDSSDLTSDTFLYLYCNTFWHIRKSIIMIRQKIVTTAVKPLFSSAALWTENLFESRESSITVKA